MVEALGDVLRLSLWTNVMDWRLVSQSLIELSLGEARNLAVELNWAMS